MNEPFNQDMLNEKWKSFAYKIKKENRFKLHATLAKQFPKVEKNNEVVFTIDNSAQKIEVDGIKPQIQHYLRKELKNTSIQLSVIVSESNETSMKYLSDKDVFLKMAEKNAILHDLREQLGLDIEY